MDDQNSLVYWVVIVSFVMPVLLSIVIIWLVVLYQRRQIKHKLEQKDLLLKQQQMVIDRQKAIEEERIRIGSEMHDDLGSGLTTIKYLSERARKKSSDPEIVSILEKINSNSKSLVLNMSEIIWSMNAKFDDISNLTGYMRRYASEYLLTHHIPFNFNLDLKCGNQNITGDKRRNLFLIFKEVLHNAVKYSNAEFIEISVGCNPIFMITISEIGGVGFDPEVSKNDGNGLFNIERRIEKINATISHSLTDKAMITVIKYPLNPLP